MGHRKMKAYKTVLISCVLLGLLHIVNPKFFLIQTEDSPKPSLVPTITTKDYGQDYKDESTDYALESSDYSLESSDYAFESSKPAPESSDYALESSKPCSDSSDYALESS